MKEIVKCYSGFRYCERPKSFLWENEWYEISSIQAQSRTPQGSNFRVITIDTKLFELNFDEANNSWSIKPL